MDAGQSRAGKLVDALALLCVTLLAYAGKLDPSIVAMIFLAIVQARATGGAVRSVLGLTSSSSGGGSDRPPPSGDGGSGSSQRIRAVRPEVTPVRDPNTIPRVNGVVVSSGLLLFVVGCALALFRARHAQLAAAALVLAVAAGCAG